MSHARSGKVGESYAVASVIEGKKTKILKDLELGLLM